MIVAVSVRWQSENILTWFRCTNENFDPPFTSRGYGFESTFPQRSADNRIIFSTDRIQPHTLIRGLSFTKKVMARLRSTDSASDRPYLTLYIEAAHQSPVCWLVQSSSHGGIAT